MQANLLDINKIERSDDCIAIYDRDLRFITWNHACEKKFKVSKQQALGVHVAEVFPFAKNDFRLRCLDDVLSQKKTFFFPNMPFTTIEGYYTQLLLPLFDEADNITGVVSITRTHALDIKIEPESLMTGAFQTALY